MVCWFHGLEALEKPSDLTKQRFHNAVSKQTVTNFKLLVEVDMEKSQKWKDHWPTKLSK